MSFPKYSMHKDSGVYWLGDIPAHWEQAPLWSLFNRIRRNGHADEQLLSVYRDHGVIPKASRSDNFNKASDDLSAYQLVDIGDLAINKMKAWQGSVAISNYRGIVSPAYHVYVSKHNESPRYLHYLFRSGEYISGYLANSKGIRVNQWDLEPQQHSRMPVILPPLAEQTQIARFLDHETAKIDALIAEQERLINLLQEKRQAVISHAVTKGLDPNVPMKDSGVEWLGKVPSHWEVKKIKHFFTLQRGHDLASSQFKEGKYPVYGSNGVIGYHSEYTTKGPSITVGRSGSVGEVNYVSNDFWAHNTSLFLKSVRNGDMEYVYYVLLSMDLKSLAAGSAVGSLDRNNIHSRFLAIPSMSEQVDISKFLKEQLKSFDSLAEKVNENIILLKERRSALISAAVTGKIDVRDWQPPADESAFDKDVRKAGLEASA